MNVPTLYFFLVFLPHLATASVVLGVASLVLVIVSSIVGSETDSHRVWAFCNACFKLLFVCVLVFFITPCGDDMTILTGAYIVMNPAEIKQLPLNAQKAADEYLGRIKH